MPRIMCDVLNCSHNKGTVCHANVINVGGKSAEKDADTSCASFLDSAAYSHLTSNVNEHGNPCSAITCNVNTCNYNSNNICNADSIDVSGDNVQIYTETRCSTFED